MALKRRSLFAGVGVLGADLGRRPPRSRAVPMRPVAGRYGAGLRPGPVGPGLARRLRSRWTMSTSLALLAVFLIFVDVLLTVEVQGVSLEANSLTRSIDAVTMELDALESHWASGFSHAELDMLATRLGLSAPGPDQVVLLPASFLEDCAPDRPGPAQRLRHTFLNQWMRFAAMGVR